MAPSPNVTNTTNTTEISSTTTTTTNSTTYTTSNTTLSGTNVDILKLPLSALGCLLVFIVLLLLIGGCIHLLHRRRKRRLQNLRRHAFSSFDIARIFDDNRGSYTALRTGNITHVVHESSDPTRETHSYAELVLADLDPDDDGKSDEQSNIENSLKEAAIIATSSKPEPPRKCNTLSGILLTRLAGGWRRNNRSTLDRYLTTRRESTTSTNDYVDNGIDEIRSAKTLPHGRDMSSRDADGSKDTFVPEDDNLWERCSSDGSLEHDVMLRQPSDPLNARHSVMSDLLRSSWVDLPPVSQNQDYCNHPMKGSRSTLDLKTVEGVFIPEGGSDHPLQEEGVQGIQQVSQNIIDLINENFSSKVQLRESDLFQQNMGMTSATLPRAPPTKDPFLAEYFSESRPSPPSVAPKPTLPVKRVQSVTPVDSENTSPRVPSKKFASETLPRSEKRPLPPIPQKVKQLIPEHKTVLTSPSPQSQPFIPKKENETTTFCPDQSTRTNLQVPQRVEKVEQEHKTILKSPSPPCKVLIPKKEDKTTLTSCHDQGIGKAADTTPVFRASSAQGGDYENLRGKICPMLPATVEDVKHLPPAPPPAPPPKHCKPQLLVSTDSSDSDSDGNPSPTSPSVPGSSPMTSNFLKVTQQLQQILAMRLPGQHTSKRADISPSQTGTNQD